MKRNTKKRSRKLHKQTGVSRVKAAIAKDHQQLSKDEVRSDSNQPSVKANQNA